MWQLRKTKISYWLYYEVLRDGKYLEDCLKTFCFEKELELDKLMEIINVFLSLINDQDKSLMITYKTKRILKITETEEILSLSEPEGIG